MNGHTSSKQVRSRLQALGFSAILAGTVLATSASAALAMPAPANGFSRTTSTPIFNRWASKVAAQPEILGLDETTSTATTVQVPHQVAPI